LSRGTRVKRSDEIITFKGIFGGDPCGGHERGRGLGRFASGKEVARGRKRVKKKGYLFLVENTRPTRLNKGEQNTGAWAYHERGGNDWLVIVGGFRNWHKKKSANITAR